MIVEHFVGTLLVPLPAGTEIELRVSRFTEGGELVELTAAARPPGAALYGDEVHLAPAVAAPTTAEVS